jgi:putative tryptophan/tyrosine transport system substrate-binding protein
MRRRDFIRFLGGVVAVASPLTAKAQQHFKIGLLDSGIAENFTVPFMQRLEQLGYVEGKNLVVERRFAEGDRGRLTRHVRKQLLRGSGRSHVLRPGLSRDV